METKSPNKTLESLLARYQSDVHHLSEPASPEVINEVEGRLKTPLSQDLRDFLTQWNGAILFRGVLHIRSTAELALTTPNSNLKVNIVLFADSPDVLWGTAKTELGQDVFGPWSKETGLEPMFDSFLSWLEAQIQILEKIPKTDQTKLDLLISIEPNNPHLLLKAAKKLLIDNDLTNAETYLRKVTALAPEFLTAWQMLGDVLVEKETAEAKWAYLKAFREIRLPLTFPGAYCASSDLIWSLGALLPPESWKKELDALINERIKDLRTPPELELFEAAAEAWAKLTFTQSNRTEAVNQLTTLLNRSKTFAQRGLLTDLRLDLTRLELDLGKHDLAEEHLAPLFFHENREIRGKALLLLGMLVVTRKEPWAEEILEEAADLVNDPLSQAEIYLTLAERHIDNRNLPDAKKALSKANIYASQISNQRLLAIHDLLLGDTLRLEGDIPNAERSYGKSQTKAQAIGDLETGWRLALRAGDLQANNDEFEIAYETWSKALSGFKKLDLPLRAAWTHCRLGSLGSEDDLEEALKIFKETDLAVGVAAVDEAFGDPSRNLAWHLQRANTHAQKRTDARRPRPPLSRSDADGPERRIGSHEKALSKFDVGIIDILVAEIKDCSKTLESSTIRHGNPHLARYSAALDLLAHHKSYEAAKALLEHLFNDYIAGAPGRALKAALCRSDNIALVDGLLETLERGQDPIAISRATEILGWRREKLAAERLRQIITGITTQNVKRSAITALGRIGDKTAIEEIENCLNIPELSEDAAISLLLLGNRAGIAYHVELLKNNQEPKGGSAGEILGKYGDPTTLPLLKALSLSREDVALSALQGLGFMGDVRAVPHLISICAKAESALVQVASSALEIITGHHEELEKPDLRIRWKKYWERSEVRFTSGFRYRYGRLFDPSILIERLNHDDLDERLNAYDELVITTGVFLPFDADGVWRIQVHHKTAWEKWWMASRKNFPVGHWTFHGRIMI